MERRRFGVTGLLLVVLVVIFVGYMAGNMRRSGDIPYSQMRALFTEEKVQSFAIEDARLTAALRDGTTATCELYSFVDSNDVTSVTKTACDSNDVLYIPTDNTAASNTEAIG